MIVIDVEQGSPEWYEAKRGKISASLFHHIISSKTLKYAAGAADLVNKLVNETITGEIETGFRSKDMEWGTLMEPEARAWYEAMIGPVEQVGLIDNGNGVLCSPDGLIQQRKGGLEIKCPIGSTFIRWMLEGNLPGEHVAQVQGSMLVSGLNYWDFLAYHPKYPKPLYLRVRRDNYYIDKLTTCLVEFDIDYLETMEIMTA